MFRLGKFTVGAFVAFALGLIGGTTDLEANEMFNKCEMDGHFFERGFRISIGGENYRCDASQDGETSYWNAEPGTGNFSALCIWKDALYTAGAIIETHRALVRCSAKGNWNNVKFPEFLDLDE